MKRLGIAFLLSLILVPLGAGAEPVKRWEGSISAGSNGLGLGLSYRFSDFLRVRGGFNYADISVDVDAEDNNGTQGDELKYSADLELANGGLLADWYPWGGIFRVSGGGVINANDFRVKARCNNPSGCEVGDSQVSRTELGTIDVDIDVDSIGPYLGIGWDRPLDATKSWVLSFDVGAYYQGSPKVEMTSDGNCATTPLLGEGCRQQLEQEEDELEDDLEDYVFYPVASIGISYRF